MKAKCNDYRSFLLRLYVLFIYDNLDNSRLYKRTS